MKSPQAIMDCYAGMKYILAEQNKHFDTSRLALFGTSAGGHMVIGMAMIMAQRNESHLVKLVVPHIAAMSAVWLDHKKDSPELNWV